MRLAKSTKKENSLLRKSIFTWRKMTTTMFYIQLGNASTVFVHGPWLGGTKIVRSLTQVRLTMMFMNTSLPALPCLCRIVSVVNRMTNLFWQHLLCLFRDARLFARRGKCEATPTGGALCVAGTPKIHEIYTFIFLSLKGRLPEVGDHKLVPTTQTTGGSWERR